MRIEDITVELLDQVEAEQDEIRARDLVRDAVLKLGREYALARLHENRLETQCMLRARKLRMLGFEKAEIGQLFGVPRRTINKWMKGMD